MVKMRKILLLFISVFVFASSFNNEFADFDKNFMLLDKVKQLEHYQKLKTIYIKTIISGDDNDKKEVLKRLIKSSKVLKLDAKTYEKELKDLGETLIVKDNKEIKTQEKTNKKEETKPTNTYITKIHEINSKDKKGIELSIQGEIDEESIKYFKYNNNQIIQFNAALDTGRKKIEKDDYEFNIVQYNPQISRIVFNTTKNYEIKYENTRNKFQIFFNTEKQETKQEITKTPNKIEEKKEIIKEAVKTTPAITNPPKIDVKKEIKEIKPNENKTLYITNVEKTENGVALNITSNLDENDIKTSSYGKSQILEFDGVLNGTRRNYDFKTHSISVLQFNPKRVRIVLNSKANHKINYKIEDNKFYAFAGEFFTPSITKQGLNKSKFLIAIDAGHGGKDAGANAYKRYEKNITLAISLKLEKALKQKGYKVFLTRKKDIYLGLRERTKMANEKKSDLFISIHANSIADKSNADKVYGIETYFLSPARSERSKNAAAIENKSDIEEMNYFSKQTFLNFLNREKIISSNKLAIDIQGGILSAIPKKYSPKDGGVKEAPFWVLVGALMPAVLIEVGYISHPEESKNIADPIYQNHLVNGIVNGIESYFEKNKK